MFRNCALTPHKSRSNCRNPNTCTGKCYEWGTSDATTGRLRSFAALRMTSCGALQALGLGSRHGESGFGATDVFETVEDPDGKAVLTRRQRRDAKIVVLDGGIANASVRRDKNPVPAIQTILRLVNRGRGI